MIVIGNANSLANSLRMRAPMRSLPVATSVLSCCKVLSTCPAARVLWPDATRLEGHGGTDQIIYERAMLGGQPNILDDCAVEEAAAFFSSNLDVTASFCT